MLSRIIRESLVRRRRRRLLSLVAVALGITVATAVATIAVDVGDKVNRELRFFGANISITPASDGLPVVVGGVDYRPTGTGSFLAESDLIKLKQIFWKHNIVAFAPFLYVPADVEGRRVVLVGTWFQKSLQVEKTESFQTGLRELHPAWKIDGRWPADDVSLGCLVGRRLARSLVAKPGGALAVRIKSLQKGTPPSQMVWFPVRGILDSGGPEEDQMLVPLEPLQRLAGLQGRVRRVEVSALTEPDDAFALKDVTKMSPEEFDRWYCAPYASSIAYQIRQAIPDAEAKPVYQVADTEGRILSRVGILTWILVAAALATAALAVSSMMLANVLERRAEIGLFKSLGATDGRVVTLFLLEAFVLGLLGGLVGYFAGSALARRVALAVFGSPASFHWVILPAAVALALVVALAGSALPLARVLKISPATVLRD